MIDEAAELGIGHELAADAADISNLAVDALLYLGRQNHIGAVDFLLQQIAGLRKDGCTDRNRNEQDNQIRDAPGY
ncbi:hypothetical protein D3C81_1832500 [compost metagenome]